ncbi:MAG: hypothetical protein F6K40_36160 [Okeania sp. SIO3I5]|uniref:hypothetical protein n=1 Tax=Okeania sp. SIO3I5 TaxID=2607805 RepID=UPI0013BDA68C|nr:hypothetical protein [Okeania sp. SIO3I5]NEQ41343.1 hypothetical protein [Okeania sp. SIO3I5]
MKPYFFALLIVSTVTAMAGCANPQSTPTVQAPPCQNPVTENDVLAAQQSWGQAIVAIGKAENPKAEAQNTLERLYAYNLGTVLFKPTLASNEPFRGTEKEALSYFVGGGISEDKGFALAPYNNVRFENEGIITHCNTATSMGEYFFTKTDGSQIKVEFTFGYVRDENGGLKIELHHSSLPYQAQ